MDLITRSLNYLKEQYLSLQVIQIGAMDGETFDDTRSFMNQTSWDLLLVEPIPALYKELLESYKHRENCKFEQAAILEEDGEVMMLTIPPDVIEKAELPLGYKGMSAVYPLKNGFGNGNLKDLEVGLRYGVHVTVPSLTFDSLLKKHDLTTFDILICDAEGYDFSIFKQIDLTFHRPKFIRLEYINLTEQEKKELVEILRKNNYIFQIGQNIDAVPREIWKIIGSSLSRSTQLEIKNTLETVNTNLTIVSGLWDIARVHRDFEDHYIPRFKEFLEIPVNMVLFIPQDLEEIVWSIRSKHNTFVKIFNLLDLGKLYEPHWSKTQVIRTDPNWLNISGEGGWLKSSPQALNEWYNPIVQSKMFMLHDASIWNPFNTDYFFWLDAGITSTVPSGHLIHDKALDRLTDYGNPFLFLSYPYESAGEIHGFDQKEMDRIAGEPVKYVCRGGLFGGHKEQIHEANGTYYTLLQDTLNRGYMGTEESLFTLMSYREPQIYRRFMLDDNGLIVKFTEALLKNTVELEKVNKPSGVNVQKVSDRDVVGIKTNLYILTFNFPEQVLHTIHSMKKTPEWLEKPHLVLLDNSTDESAKIRNREIANEYNFEYVDLGGNRGICGGRQAAAEHFDNSDAEFMFFFEDDMTSNPPEYEGQFCRNGFKKYVPNLYNIVHKIMIKEGFDFLKLSFTEVYMDNNIQVSWYNVPQQVREKEWPDYSKLPISGLDPNAPRTRFGRIETLEGVSYITGEIYYANWPMIVSKEGNRKMFIDTKWDHPYEQTWMSYMYQLTREGNLRPAVLLASPIWHDRIKYYKPEERREN